MADNNYSQYILPVGLVAIAYAAASKFGLIPSAESKKQEADALQLDSFDAFSRNYVKDYVKKNKVRTGQKFSVQLLTTPKADAIALQLKKSKGIFNDDETAVYSAMKFVKSKSQLSQVATVFNKLTSQDLTAYLQSFMNEKELSRIYEIVKSLPSGITPIN